MIDDLRFYLKLLPRRLPIMILLFVSMTMAGLILSQRLPANYHTSATLLVEPPQIREERQDPNQPSPASEQLRVIEQRLLTRANLIDIANEVQVFPAQSSMNPDEIVEAMRLATEIQLTIGRDQASLMRLGFTSDDPIKVTAVVNRYIDIALEISSTATTSQAEDTLSFYQQEVDRYSDELDMQSGRIANFKREFADALPENLTYNQTRQSLLQERVSRAERELESLGTQRANIDRLRAREAEPDLSGEEELLVDLESDLSIARSIYSPTNPNVTNLESQVAALRARIASAASEPNETERTLSAETTVLEISLAEIDSRAATLTQEIADANQELATLLDSIRRTPANGITLSGLEREQENVQDLYNASVGRLAQAQTSLNIVAASKGERITVLEAAAVPNEPASPNRTQIALIGIAAGLGLAGGFFFLLELLNQTVRRPADIVRKLEITPLATIPRIETIGQKRMRRVLQISASLVVLAAVPTIIWAIDTYYMPLDLLYEKVKDRLI
jgi:uncharacterized protein involved in exopolysaccharide biosynthesis